MESFWGRSYALCRLGYIRRTLRLIQTDSLIIAFGSQPMRLNLSMNSHHLISAVLTHSPTGSSHGHSAGAERLSVEHEPLDTDRARLTSLPFLLFSRRRPGDHLWTSPPSSLSFSP